MDNTVVNYPRSKAPIGFLVAGGTALLLILTLLFPGLTPWSPAAAAPPGGPAQCGAHYFALDSGKESTNAFGPPVSTRNESEIKGQLRERRLCGTDKLGDPTLTAAHYAGWSATGLTKQTVAFTAIYTFSA